MKTQLLGPSALLRNKTPDLVQHDLEGLILAHQVVHSMIREVTERVGADPDQLSFRAIQ